VSDDIDRVAGGNASALVTEAVRDKIARDAYGEPDAEAYAHWIARLTPATPPAGQRAS
jgi:hypothetical protein